jgi:polyhydroxyalkanoate synthesis regulator phasin
MANSSSGGGGKSTPSERDQKLRAGLGQLRELLSGGVVLTANRIQEAMDEAVARGRMTRQDAEELVAGLVTQGRQQAVDVLADLEQLVGRTRAERNTAAGRAADLVAREVERARRAVVAVTPDAVTPDALKEPLLKPEEAVERAQAAEEQLEGAAADAVSDAREAVAEEPPAAKPRAAAKPKAKAASKPKGKATPKAPKKAAEPLPVADYDGLTVKQVQAKLVELNPAELEVVREHEQRTKARKGILDAIERRLS